MQVYTNRSGSFCTEFTVELSAIDFQLLQECAAILTLNMNSVFPDLPV
jgi:hypothetical protein